jgi:hypothetical protein
MRMSSRGGSCLLLTSVLSLVAGSQAAPGDVKTSFDSPCRYPAGLASDGAFLYLVDWRQARLYCINPAEKATVWIRDLPTLRPRGVACADGAFFVSDDRTGLIELVDAHNGTVKGVFAAPGPEPAGLCWVDGALWVLERRTRKVYRLDPHDGTILGDLALPDAQCEYLAHDGRYLWMSNRVKDELYLVDPATGMVLGILPAPGPYAVGLAWQDGFLWNADFQTRRLYQLVIFDEPMYRLSDRRVARCEYYWALYNYGPGQVCDLVVNVALPHELPSQKLLSGPKFAVPWKDEKVDRWGQPCRTFFRERLGPHEKFAVSYCVDVELSAIRYLLIPERVGTLDQIPEQIRKEYTVDAPRYQISSQFIQETARKVAGDERNAYWVARKIYNYVIDRLEYEMAGGWDTPEVVLKRGRGSCSEYTFAFIALCRAAGLPARYQGSVVVRGDDASVDEAFHRWAEVYLPNYGWVPVDANRGDSASPVEQARGFGELSNRFLITTIGGGDSELLRWSYNADAQYRLEGYCRVEEENFGCWEPLPAEEAPDAQPAAQ